tara:strand:+ start:726 stop:4238 length:3513 start_codon:yes stop_codon:yes gene_type:complete
MIINKIIILSFITCLFCAEKLSKINNFSILYETQGFTSILFEPNEVEIKLVDGKSKFVTNDFIGLTMDEGKPQLPVYSTLFQIDPNKAYEFDVEVLDSYFVNDIEFEHYKNDEELNYDIYPNKNLYVSEPQVWRDIVLNQIGITPYKYYPESKKLEVYSSIKINIAESGPSYKQYDLPIKKSRVFEEFYETEVINYQRTTRSEDYQTPSILYICGGSSCSNGYFQDLVEWRHKQGYEVAVVPTSESGSSESAIDNYIRNAYFIWENPPEIVGLVGDVGGSYNIACDYYEWGSGWDTYEGASDVKYTYIDGNDFLPEVVIGRISADSNSDLNNIINKTIQYEKAILQTDRGWFDRSGLIGDPTQSGLSCAITSEWIRELMNIHGHNDVDADLNGGSDSQLEDYLEDQFNRGIMYYNYRGIYGSGGAYMPSNGNNLSNGYYTPFATVLTCGTGDFNYDDDSEDFIRVGSVTNPKGAVGCVGISTTGTHTAYNNILNMGIYEGIYSNGVSYAGSATTSGRLAIYKTYPANPGDCVGAFSAWTNLMGDPALHLWTDTPKDFVVEGLLPQIQLGTNHLNLTISNTEGDLVEDARVTLLMGDDVIFESNYTDNNGNVSFNWGNDTQTGTLYVTVTKQNYRPLENSLNIVGDYAINYSVSETFNADSGSTIDLPDIFIQSIGSESISELNGTLVSSSEYVSINNSTSSWTLSGNNEWSINNNNFNISLSQDAVYGDEINFILNLSDGDSHNWEIYFPLIVNSAKITVNDFLTTEYPEPGQSTELFLQVQNDGNLLSPGVSATIASNSNLINVENSIVSFGNLDVGQVGIADISPELSFSPNILNGSIFPLEIKFSDENSYSRSNFVNLTVGTVQNTDPLGPNQYGYYIYDSSDIDYEYAPVYEWIEIDTNYGGSGQDLNLTDGGDGNNATNSTGIVSLPFDFNFYGDTYNEITVSTNGWIVLGRTDVLSFRNYPIPGAGGPSPMIAVFWDDMKTSQGGDVFYKSFPNGCQGNDCEYMVIEWSDMRTQIANSDEDFQIILYNGTDTPTSDSEFKMQYKTFNNTSNGYYPEGGRPDHGCYVTIGIENKFGNEGIQYTFNNEYPPGATRLTDGSALFVTTQSPFIFYGDVNGDEILNVLDIVVLLSMILGQLEPDFIGDMNQDGIINILDVVILVNNILA